MKKIIIFILVGIGCIGCGDRATIVEITEIRDADPYQPPPAVMTAEERFGYSIQLPNGHPLLDETHISEEASTFNSLPGFSWDVPEGWVVGETHPMRIVTLLAGRDRSVECYVSEMGRGGGVKANLNR